MAALVVVLTAIVLFLIALLTRERLQRTQGYAVWQKPWQERVNKLEIELSQQQQLHARELQAASDQYRSDLNQARHELELSWEQKKRTDRAQSNARSRSALLAKVAEHVAPFLPDFAYNPKDARHVGELFDFLVFDGLEEGHIKNVVFLEVKTGRSHQARQLNSREKLLRDAITAKRVMFQTYVPNLEQENR